MRRHCDSGWDLHSEVGRALIGKRRRPRGTLPGACGVKVSRGPRMGPARKPHWSPAQVRQAAQLLVGMEHLPLTGRQALAESQASRLTRARQRSACRLEPDRRDLRAIHGCGVPLFTSYADAPPWTHTPSKRIASVQGVTQCEHVIGTPRSLQSRCCPRYPQEAA